MLLCKMPSFIQNQLSLFSIRDEVWDEKIDVQRQLAGQTISTTLQNLADHLLQDPGISCPTPFCRLAVDRFAVSVVVVDESRSIPHLESIDLERVHLASDVLPRCWLRKVTLVPATGNGGILYDQEWTSNLSQGMVPDHTTLDGTSMNIAFGSTYIFEMMLLVDYGFPPCPVRSP